MMNDDYYSQFSYNHMSTSTNTHYGNHLNTANMNTNAYGSFHSMQAAHNNQNYNHSLVHSHNNNLHSLHSTSHHHHQHHQQQHYMHSNSSTPSYITLSSTTSSSTTPSQSSTQSASNAALNSSFNAPNSKISNRTASSINSTMCSSSSSSSSSPASNSSFNNINQTLSSTSIEDYDASIEAAVAASLSNVTASPANDPAELARIKQMSGLKLTPDEVQLLVKDRQRKDNHNMSKFPFLIPFIHNLIDLICSQLSRKKKKIQYKRQNKRARKFIAKKRRIVSLNVQFKPFFRA